MLVTDDRPLRGHHSAGLPGAVLLFAALFVPAVAGWPAVEFAGWDAAAPAALFRVGGG